MAPRRVTVAWMSTGVPARVVLSPFAAICPATIRAPALARLGARPAFQTGVSRRLRLAVLDVTGDDVRRNLSEAFRTRTKIGEGGNALLHELRGALARGFNTQECWIGDFFEHSITPNLFADGGGIAFDVEQVIGNLIRPTDVVAIAFEGLHLFRGAATE